MASSKNKKPDPSTEPHELRFVLVTAHLVPLKDPRNYTLSYTLTGETKETVKTGTTDAKGQTELIKTTGPVAVTLAIAQPDSTDCKMVGVTSTRPKNFKPEVRVVLDFHETVTTAPTATKQCVALQVLDRNQQIRYTIKNVASFGGSKNYLTQLPYLVVNADTLEVLPNDDGKGSGVRYFQGSHTLVSTATFPVDGVQNVGIVLGNATDDSVRWKSFVNNLVMYSVTPKPSGLTEVVISETTKNDPSKTAPAKAKVKNDYTATLDGGIWAFFTRLYTVDDLPGVVPGTLHVSTAMPTDMQISWAQENQLIDANTAARYRAARAAFETYKTAYQAQVKATAAAQQAVAAQAKAQASLDKATADSKAATGNAASGTSSAGTAAKLAAASAAMQTAAKQVTDATAAVMKAQATQAQALQASMAAQAESQKLAPLPPGQPPAPGAQPLYALEYDVKWADLLKPIYAASWNGPRGAKEGGGSFLIRPLGLALTLDGEACKNAVTVADPLQKEEVLSRTHPYTYTMALECAYQCHITSMTLSSTWRPMIGSVLHKLGDALDITVIDDCDDGLAPFKFNHAPVDSLADRFTRALASHRFAARERIYYAYDNLTYSDGNSAPDAQHTDHLHITANRFAKSDSAPTPAPIIAATSAVTAAEGRQRFVITGQNFTPQSKVELVQFAQDGTAGTPITRNAFPVAEGGSIAWDAHFGDPGRWQVTVMNPDGKRSNPMSFEVAPPPDPADTSMSSITVGNKY